MGLIEQIFALSPDGGSGATEAILLGTAALALVALILRHSVRLEAVTGNARHDSRGR